MIAQYFKELKSYFSNILGYLIIAIYLLGSGLLLWVLDTPFNLMNAGYAQLDNYFALAPWIFLLLIPAVGMRLFADERKTGMMELLLIRPMTAFELVFAKYLATLTVVLAALLPTLVYLYSMSALGSPVGNLDWGGAIGSFMGLVALVCVYVAVALFASSLTSNAVVALLLGMTMSLAVYTGFDALAELYRYSGFELLVKQLGINEHYRAMARGVVDLSDLWYFIALTAVLLLATAWRIAVNGQAYLKRTGIALVVGVAGVIGLTTVHARWDLTEDKRFSLSEGTVKLLQQVEEPLLIKVYLDGEFPASFSRLQQECIYLLQEFSAEAPNVFFEFINPNNDKPEFANQLASKGIRPIQLEISDAGSQKMLRVFPGAILSYKERESVAILLEDVFTNNPMEQINVSVQQLEYNLAGSIRSLLQEDKKRIAFITGHDELSARETAGIGRVLSQNYHVERFSTTTFIETSTGAPDVEDMIRRLNTFDLAIIAKPRKAFTDMDKYLLDQFVMGGGKTMWFVDGVYGEMDSLSAGPQFLSYPTIYDLNITDLLFMYGVRINGDLIKDARAALVSDQRNSYPWVYFPLFIPESRHPVVANLNAIKGEFCSSIDTVEAPGVKKTVLLHTSDYSTKSAAPTTVSLTSLYQRPDPALYKMRKIPVGYLLEGEFQSAYAHRITPKSQGSRLPQIPKSVPTAMVVFSDGDLIKNQLNLTNPDMPRMEPLELGYDQFTNMQYGNEDLILNTIDYLLDHSGLLETRTRSLKLRLLNAEAIDEPGERAFWKWLNVGVPLLLLAFFGTLLIWSRKRKYAK